jgi:hypothetical protein
LNFRNNVTRRHRTTQNGTEAFLAALAGGLGDDFPDDISDEDLGVDAPRKTFD